MSKIKKIDDVKTTKESISFGKLKKENTVPPPPLPPPNNNAIKTLVIGCRLAQEKGVYTLEEARTIMNAIDFLNSNEEK